MIKYIIIFIILIAVLSYFGVNIKSIVESDIFKENFGYVWNWCKYVWETYLAGPAKYLWNDVFVDLLWNSFIENLKRINEGKGPEMIEQGPRIDFPNQNQ